MSWDETWVQPQRWDEFAFYSYNSTPMSEILSFATVFRLGTIQLHFSTSFVSVEDLVIKKKAIQGSEYDVLLISKSMSGITDYILIFDSVHIPFVSGDAITFLMSLGVPNVNTWGILATGWSVRG